MLKPTWVPNLNGLRGPLYHRIYGALARDIYDGKLVSGERLPTQRALADAIGVTVSTITKAYAEAEQSGLLVSRTGRGTFVKSFPEHMVNNGSEPFELIDFSRNITSFQHFNPMLNRLMGALARRGSLHGLLEYQPHPGPDRFRVAGARWIARRDLHTSIDQIILCNGVQEGLLTALSTLAKPGDTVLTENLNYVGIRHVAELLRITLRGVACDAEGMRPDALEKAWREERNVAALLITPTNHNPTTAFMPLSRRRLIASFAERNDLMILEDDTFGHLTNDDVPTLAALAPNHCIYMCGFSKSIAAGVRLGYIVTPLRLRDALVESLYKIHGHSPAFAGELATLMIEQGHADEIVTWHREEAARRHQLAVDILGIEPPLQSGCYHLWVPLPRRWTTADFVQQLAERGVQVSPANKFLVDHSPPPAAIRVSLGGESDVNRIKHGLELIAEGFTGRSNSFAPSLAQKKA